MIVHIALGFAFWLPVALFVMAFAEYIAHRWVMHHRVICFGKRASAMLNRLSYNKHDRGHHFGKLNHPVHVHIDLPVHHHLVVISPLIAWLVYRGCTGFDYAWGGVIVWVLLLKCHSYIWSKMHRAIHGIEDNWLGRVWFFPIFSRHHLDHHLRPNRNFSVVFLFTDYVFRTKWKSE